MIDSAIFLFLVPGFFFTLAGVLAYLAFTESSRETAKWGAVAFFAAGAGAMVDIYRPADDEWARWVALALHFATLVALSLAFLSRKGLGLPRLAVASLLVPLAFLPLLGIAYDEATRTTLVQIAAFILTGSVVVALVRSESEVLIDRIAIILMGAGSFSYLVRAFMFAVMVAKDTPGRNLDDVYNLIFQFMSAAFGFLSGIALLVAVGVDAVLIQVRRSAIDPLTGLGNRRALDDAIDTEGQRKWRCGGVIVIDMDHFKAVNDRYGHPEGDRLLVAVARALRARLGEGGHLCRLGGEEFVLLVEQSHKERIEQLAHGAHEAISELRFDGALAGYAPSASVGFHSRNAGATLTEAIRLADQALYRAKALGRNRVVGARHARGVTVMSEGRAERAAEA